MRPNVFTAEFEYEGSEPEGYRSGEAPAIREASESKAQTVRLYEIPEDESTCPYHYEYEEEWLLVLAGELVLRDPDGEHTLVTGDLVCFPAGPAGAHKLTNRGGEAARAMMWSSSREPAFAVYPDSDKIGVWPGNSQDDVMLRREDGRRDYWDREP
jgi:uncharacterized cupin superfamily protein